jgi:hypothetical protein
MCLACEMDALWFAAMEARARAVTAEGLPQPGQPVQAATSPALPPLENERVGEGIAGGKHGVSEESADPHPHPPPEEGGGSTARRFCCEETPAE